MKTIVIEIKDPGVRRAAYNALAGITDNRIHYTGFASDEHHICLYVAKEKSTYICIGTCIKNSVRYLEGERFESVDTFLENARKLINSSLVINSGEIYRDSSGDEVYVIEEECWTVKWLKNNTFASAAGDKHYITNFLETKGYTKKVGNMKWIQTLKPFYDF